MLIALLASFGDAAGLIIDKLILSRKKLGLNVFLPLTFLLLFLFTVLLTPWFGGVNWDIAGLSNELFLLFLLIVIAIAWNVLYYQSLQHEKVHHTELIMMFAPLVTVILAAIFFPENFDARIFVLALIASLALIFSKSTKEHFLTSKSSYNTFLAVILMSTEAIIIKELLVAYKPVTLYAVRTFFVAIFFFFYYRPKQKALKHAQWGMIIASSLFGLMAMIGRYYAFAQLGVIYTTLIMILGPIIVFLASWEILHEKVRPRMIVASVVVLVCVALATVLTVR